MNKLCCLIVMFITCRICEGQNLVPNGNFEQYSGCPTDLSQLDSVLFWFNPTDATPDYYNQCSNPSDVGVPNNLFGFQPAHSGVGYCGIHRWGGLANWREYIEVALQSPLVANTCYHLEMYINLADSVKFTTDAIGAYFSDTLTTNFSTVQVLLFIPQINNTAGNVPDTINWTLVAGNFIANGGESYMIIGNFKNDINTTVTVVNNSASSSFLTAYTYIDDVSLTPCTGIEEQNNNEAIKIYPNPANDNLNIAINNNELSEIILYDVASRKLLQQKFENSTSINIEQFAKGIYIYEVRNKNGVIEKGKIVKE